MRELVPAKLACLALLLAETFVGACIPLAIRLCTSRLRNGAELRARCMAVASAATAGVFLGVGACHMLVDASADLAELTAGPLHGFPLAQALLVLGFVVLLALDVIAPHEHVGDEEEGKCDAETAEEEQGASPAVELSTATNGETANAEAGPTVHLAETNSNSSSQTPPLDVSVPIQRCTHHVAPSEDC
eukprot:TRINITY_DN5440_c0_g1_i1.p2 TRINITY_DN5440_c0_g1~~TRINITY_DN5440_c0_g1_i1.p2  ORF type:complete len:189 (-),score=48.86 TRINITY_DN5440_c0_g1_i1:615-1181(-)